ncbi:MAG: WxL domain-containing protein [Streptococcaceae bacterium]|jgi:hypothetical protein|nr:WxL domain-containing protein [Streptococcaceae bacterium]
MKKILLMSLPTILFLASGMVIHANEQNTHSYASKAGVSFYESETGTPPTNPVTPNPNNPLYPMEPDETAPNPGTGGSLSLDYASSFDFGVHKISTKNEVYDAQAQRYFDSSVITPDYVQVSDERGTLAGWVLKLKETSQFHATEETEYDELSGAALSLTKPVVVSNNNSPAPSAQEVINLVPGTEAIIMIANPGQGAGTWITRWGEVSDLHEETQKIGGKDVTKEFSTAITLSVPGATPKDPVNYKTTLMWILSDLPQN